MTEPAPSIPFPSARSRRDATEARSGAAPFLAAAAIAAWFLWPRSPADDGADAGFARDMAIHHAQAVEMAWIAAQRTDDPAIRTLATDIVLTQQAQLGMMRGWLDAWGLPPNGANPVMAWMPPSDDAMAGMAAPGGAMPGMATAAEVASLGELSPAAMDRRFLELMIRHHGGGVGMAESAVALAERPEVRRLAETIAVGQQFEIDAMRTMLATRPAFDQKPPVLPDREGSG